ncbi:MAG: hypothetical protein H6740_00715 [Alphaproteobacteria bacterium]|nr:hypothetical protein [Alphaproteobacteria bacterium]
MTLLLALAACGDPAVEPLDSAVPDPGPYIYEEEAPPEPALGLSEIEDAITEAVVNVFALNATPVIAGYATAMSGQEEGCPDYYSDGSNTYWYDYCTSADGSYFSGYGFIYEYEDYDAGDGYLYSGSQVYTVADVTNGDGYSFSGSGAATDLVLTSDGGGDGVPHTVMYSIIQGTFSWDGPEATGTWLDLGQAPDLTIAAYNVPEETSPNYHGNYVAMEGGVGGLGDGDTTVVLDGVAIFEASLASTCPIEPSGLISVRDPSGNWYDVLFDGPAEVGAQSDVSACDGCGEAWYRGERVGQVCADFSALLEWEGSPW